MSQQPSKRLPFRFYCISSSDNTDLKQIEIVTKSYFDESDIPVLYFCILQGFWIRTKVFTGDVLHILNPIVDDTVVDSRNGKCCQTLIVNNERGLVILNPDTLISTTTLMGASHCMRKMWLQTMFNIYGETSLPLVLGSAVHQLFQECLHRKVYSLDGIMALYRTEILKQLTFDLYSLGMSVSDFEKEIQPYLGSINRWLMLYMLPQPKSSNEEKQFVVKRLHDIENEIWSSKYGVIGKMDITLEAEITEGLSYEDYTKIGVTPKQTIHQRLIPLELKTGKHTFSPAHMGQVIMYSYIIQDKYRHERPNDGYLVYLKDDITTQIVKSNYNVFRDILILRNSFQVFHNRILDLTSKSDNIKMRIPERINNLRFCQTCEFLTECSLFYNCFESKNDVHSSNNIFETSISHLSTSDLDFFQKNITLLELEKQYSVHREQTDRFWNISSEEHESNGNGLSKLEIRSQNNDGMITFYRSKKCKLTPILFGLYEQSDKQPIKYSSFIGKRAMINEEILVSKACLAIFGNYCKQISCGIGFIDSFNDDYTEINIRLDKNIVSTYNEKLIYRVDILNVLSHRPMHTNFANIARLMSPNDERCRELRDIVIRGHFPKNNVNTSILASLQKVYESHILENLNPNQKKAVIGVLRTRCSLIFGCPGSGKTQTIVSLIRVLHSLGFSVLVTSFTHVAVDNILIKLINSNRDNNEQVDFLRIGASARVHEFVKSHSEYEKTREFIEQGNVEALTAFYKNIPIVACTALGVAGHAIFQKRTFDYCILDEASQVVLATCLGPLFMARNFVLVGDQKQLPPVIQNPSAKNDGLEESLFSRLLGFVSDEHDPKREKEDTIIDDVILKKERSPLKRRFLSTKDSLRVFPLFIQYRMNKVIMSLANQMTYSGKLTCGNKTIEFGTLQEFSSKNKSEINFDNYLDRALSPSLEDSVVFLDIDKIPDAKEIQIDEKDDKENCKATKKNMFGTKGKNQVGYVYNEFEAKLIVRLVHELLTRYSAGGLSASQIGIVSPFRKQVQRIKELLGDELVREKVLEINTVDQYQGRDKEVIIYSCVKSFIFPPDTDPSTAPSQSLENDNSQDSFVSHVSTTSSGSSGSNSIFKTIFDSELLKDERRLNVAITRAKKKLIIVGNRATLARYEPFQKLFDVMPNDMFVPLFNDVRDESCLL